MFEYDAFCRPFFNTSYVHGGALTVVMSCGGIAMGVLSSGVAGMAPVVFPPNCPDRLDVLQTPRDTRRIHCHHSNTI